MVEHRIEQLVMSFSLETDANRREFFRAAARYGLLGLVSVATLVLGRRASATARCINRGICRGCRVFTVCGLPAALSAKAFEQRTSL